MNINKNVVILLTCCITHQAFAGDDKPKEKPTRLLLPVDLLIHNVKPAREPGIDYTIYKVGNAEWPDWDYSDPRMIEEEETSPQSSSKPDIQISATAPQTASPEPQPTPSARAPFARLSAAFKSITKKSDN